MDELQNQQTPQESQPQIKENFINKKTIIIVVIIVVLLLVGLGVWILKSELRNQGPNMPYGDDMTIPSTSEIQKETPQDTTSAINNELDNIGIESIDDSFKEIDADLNNL